MATATNTTTGLDLTTLRAAEGCVAYLIWDRSTRDGLVIDPRLDQVEGILEEARSQSVRIRMVFDTHTHADHFSGARRLAARAGAQLLSPAASKLEAPTHRVAPGSSFELGNMSVSVLAAPGHTPDSAALLVDGHLFTGDALFLEGVGRTDFPGGSGEDLLKTLERFEALPKNTLVHPGHDYQKLGAAPLEELQARHPVLAEKSRPARLERVSGSGVAIPDIRHFLAWNLAKDETGERTPRVAEALVRGGSAAFVDVRPAPELAQMKIAGAVAAPLADLEALADGLPKDKELILVCRSGVMAYSAKDMLARRSIQVSILEGGINAWQSAGLPLTGLRTRGMSLDRQTQLMAGAMVFVGVLLGAFVSPWALLLPGFVGSGLMFAGISGMCGLTKILALLPWNRAAAAPVVSVCSAGGTVASTCSAGGALTNK